MTIDSARIFGNMRAYDMSQRKHTQEENGEIALAKTLGIPEVSLLGVGALLGGGIFTLLGHAAGFAGGGLVLAMFIGSAIAFINLNAYIALATTFPAAGGGYHWVRAGLGDINGFLSGWCSWMASAVACALYAVSFGLFAEELFFGYLELPRGALSPSEWQSVFTSGVVVLFGLVNYRGVRLSGRVGGVLAITILGILAAYIGFGARSILEAPAVAVLNFSDILPMGIAGILQAAALFYIAFEGSEIQAQTGEEVKDPARVLKAGLFSSWAIVSIVYVLIALVIIGATDGGGVPSWQVLNDAGGRAIIVSAQEFMPMGYLIMLLGGILANLGALNATIYSSSRVLFAMARDRLVLTWFGRMDPLTFVPSRALLLSIAIILCVALWFPLRDIAGAADILFIALFLQLNLAYIQLRREKPDAKWRYVIPFGPTLPLVAASCYLVLGVALFHVSPTAIMFLVVWLLLGLVNYFSYSLFIRREDHDREIVYEHSMRFHPKSEYRVVLPVGTEESGERFNAIAYAMTKEEGGDLIALRIHEMHAGERIEDAFSDKHDEEMLRKIERKMAEAHQNVDTRVVASRSIPEAILETVAAERADLVLMNWDGDVDTKGYVFGRKVDTVLRRAKCDMLTVKLGTDHAMKNIFIPVAIDGNPNLRFTGKVATALAHAYGGTVTVGMVVPVDARGEEEEYFRRILREHVDELKVKTDSGVESKILYSDYLASGILKAVSGYDIVLLPAARGSIASAIGVGTIPEQVAKNCRRKTIIIAKGYRGIARPFTEYIREWF